MPTQSDSLTIDQPAPKQVINQPSTPDRLTSFGSSYDTAVQVAEWNDQFRWGPEPDEAEPISTAEAQATPQPSPSPVEVVGLFGQHTKEKAEKLQELKQHLIGLLDKDPTKTVLVVLEAALLTDTLSQAIYDKVAAGIKPSDAYRQALKEAPDELRTMYKGRKEERVGKELEQSFGVYSSSTLKILDELWEDPKYKGRLRLRYEGRAQTEIKEEIDLEDQLLPKFSKSDLENPLAFQMLISRFKQSISFLALTIIRRNDSVTESIQSAIHNQQDLSGVVVLFGTVHSLLAPRLQTPDLSSSANISSTILDAADTARTFYFDPLLQILRKIEAKVKKVPRGSYQETKDAIAKVAEEISVFDWQKAIVATAVHGAALRLAEKNGLKLSEQLIIARVMRVVRRFPTSEEFTAFLSDKGFSKMLYEVVEGKALAATTTTPVKHQELPKAA